MLRSMLFLLSSSYSVVVSMDNTSRPWVSYNLDTKQYEYKFRGDSGKKRRVSVADNNTQIESKPLITPLAQASCRTEGEVLRDYFLIKHFLARSFQNYNDKKYGYARVYLHKIGRLLQNPDAQLKNRLRSDSDVVQAYPNYFQNQFVAAYNLCLRTWIEANHDDANDRAQYNEHFYAVLALLG